ncbi:MAG: hypothetical protein DSY57_01960, partial [Desulfobulbus sp.]
MRQQIKNILFLVLVISGLSVLPAAANTTHTIKAHENHIHVAVAEHHGAVVSSEHAALSHVEEGSIEEGHGEKGEHEANVRQLIAPTHDDSLPWWLLAIPFLPLASFIFTLLFGKRLGVNSHWVPIIAVLISFSCALKAFLTVKSGHFINQDLYTWISS